MIERQSSNVLPHRGGFNALEVMSALAILSLVTSFAAELPRTVLRRERIRSAAREIHTVVLVSRMEAVKRNADVVVHVDLERRMITTWAEAGARNFAQDAGERTITQFPLPESVVFRGLDGEVNGADAVAFDTYGGDRRLTDRIVFRGDGSLVAPESENSRMPGKPQVYGPRIPYSSVACRETGCRGIYFSDRAGGAAGRNLFRVSVDDAHMGRVSLLKWVPPGEGGSVGEAAFAPAPWTWAN